MIIYSQKNHGVTQKPHIINVHGHYIIFKGSFEHSPSMNIAFIRSRGIANKYDTPLDYDIKNININREWLISKCLWKENKNEYFK